MSEVMEINATEAIENIIDRSKWTKWKFSDLVDNIVEKVVPKESGLEHYIGLEHLDTGSLKIRRFGETSSLKGDKLKIYKGDLIFAKRNAYLKRVAIADFDAVASAHSMVLRPNPENVLPEFLPFFLLSEKFWQRAIEISVGSLSPTINWKVLAKQEFLLPPKDQQAQLAKLLWAMDEVIESSLKSKNSVNLLYKSEREHLILKEGESNELNYNSRLKEEVNIGSSFSKLDNFLTDIRYGTSKKGNTEGKGVPVLGIPNVVQEKLLLDSLNYSELEGKELSSCTLNKGDIVIVRTNGNPEYTGKSALYNIDENHAFASYLIKISVDNEALEPDFIVRFLQTKTARRYFKRHATSTAGNYNINTETIKGIPVPILSKEKQSHIVKKLKSIELRMDELSSHYLKSKSLQKSLINQVF